MHRALRFMAAILSSFLLLSSLLACDTPHGSGYESNETTAADTGIPPSPLPEGGIRMVITARLLYIEDRYFLAQDEKDPALVWRISGTSAAAFQPGQSVTVTLLSKEEPILYPKDEKYANSGKYERLIDAVAKSLTAALEVEDILPPADFEPK